jgi:hypothetical protein
LWKEHFARQITVAERTIMKTFQAQHLTTGEMAKIAKLSNGKFVDTVLYRLVSALSTSFESYNPDNTVNGIPQAALPSSALESQAQRIFLNLNTSPPYKDDRES